MEKLKLYPYSQRFANLFEKEERRISKVLGDCEIYHIGSTAIPGLGGKGIIDIMIVLQDWKKEKETLQGLRTLGFTHVHPKVKGRIFLSKKGPTKYRDIHIHLVKKGNRTYQEMLFFRDHLTKNRKEAKRYFKLKTQWFKVAKGDREEYTKLKGDYIAKIVHLNQ